MLEPLYKEGKFITKSPVSVQNLSGEEIASIELFIIALQPLLASAANTWDVTLVVHALARDNIQIYLTQAPFP